MSLVEQFNIGSRIKAVTAVVFATTQTSAGLSTTQDGLTVDRNAAGLRRYYSAKAIVAGVFAAGSSMRYATLTINVQHSSDGTSWDNYSTATVPATVTFGASSSGNALGTTAGTAANTVEQSLNLNGARRYMRIQVPNPTFQDCSSSVVLSYAGVFVFGGGDELPAQ